MEMLGPISRVWMDSLGSGVVTIQFQNQYHVSDALKAIRDQHFEYDGCVRQNQLMDHHCRGCNMNNTFGISAYDFLYLPADMRKNKHRSHQNKGYAFVNMTTPVGTTRLYEAFRNMNLGDVYRPKICSVEYAYLQGLEAEVNYFTQYNVQHGTEVPVVFDPPRDGLIFTPPRPI
ncbi:protein terminal ear1 homolog [Bidens hawaiensis]|uniref:protein terminal ear1 homolog n=1 Tax=Bidens hawaiensis TaxID=980011 RepID=UPI00404ACE8D